MDGLAVAILCRTLYAVNVDIFSIAYNTKHRPLTQKLPNSCRIA
jgi:hypothetical protein